MMEDGEYLVINPDAPTATLTADERIILRLVAEAEARGEPPLSRDEIVHRAAQIARKEEAPQ